MKVQLLLLLGLVSFALSVQVWDNGMIVNNLVKTAFGPSFIGGELGFVAELNEVSVQNFIERKLGGLFLLNENVKFILERSETDIYGMMHFRFDQKINGFPVDNTKLIIHVNPKTHNVFAISSDIVPGWEFPTVPTVSADQARESIVSLILSSQYKIVSDVELVYVSYNEQAFFAYKADIIYFDGEDEMRSYFYLDAIENTLIVELNRYLNAKNRNVYSANNGANLPGTLVRNEGSLPSTDNDVNDAYTYTGVCYDYYFQTFGRDSYDNNGATLSSTVHYWVNYNNAFWNGQQMVFGDGDGVTFIDFAGDLTVVCHELTHAVVEYTAGLIYSQQSGALNEGFADIFGFASYMYQFGTDTPYQWMIGAECYTPGIEGDALRYMNNPVEDGASYDYYPGYQGPLDNGGVHWNSGIANLAFVLAVQGGTHPQQKSTIFVEPIGTQAAESIFYTALANYLTPNSQFANARASSVAAAVAAYGQNSKQAITADDCWEAVGVPGSSV